MLLLSIIIPVFNNSGKDIERCINSLQNSYNIKSEYEIILIDDGSRNDCANFLDHIATNFTNIRVFHQKNQGVSNARNLGIRLSLGKYVAFVDADDVVTPNFIPDAIWAVSNTQLDIIYGYIEYVEEDNSFNHLKNIYDDDNETETETKTNLILLSEKEKKELYCHFFDLSKTNFWHGEYYISRGPVARLVRKIFAVQNLFDETLCMGEDAVWNLQALKNADTVGVIERLWYYYIKNSLSATQVFNEDSIKQYGDMIWQLSKYATDDSSKACLLNKTISSACELAKGLFLSKHYPGGFFTAVKEFNHLFSKAPWNSVLDFSYAYMVGLKCCIKYLLIKTGLLLWFLKLKETIVSK